LDADIDIADHLRKESFGKDRVYRSRSIAIEARRGGVLRIFIYYALLFFTRHSWFLECFRRKRLTLNEAYLEYEVTQSQGIQSQPLPKQRKIVIVARTTSDKGSVSSEARSNGRVKSCLTIKGVFFLFSLDSHLY